MQRAKNASVKRGLRNPFGSAPKDPPPVKVKLHVLKTLVAGPNTPVGIEKKLGTRPGGWQVSEAMRSLEYYGLVAPSLVGGIPGYTITKAGENWLKEIHDPCQVRAGRRQKNS